MSTFSDIPLAERGRRWLHVGCGKLGLGLPVAVANSVGVPPTLLAVSRDHVSDATMDVQASLAEVGAYELRVATGSGVDRHRVHCASSDIDDIVPEGRPTTWMLTLAVGTTLGLDVSEKLIQMARRLQVGGDSLLVIPCENRLSPEYVTALERLSETATVCRSVVDRICDTRGMDDYRDRGGVVRRVFVTAEKYWSWIVEASDTETQQQLGLFFDAENPAIEVQLVDDIEPYRSRKDRLVNGTHLVLALKMVCQKNEPRSYLVSEFMKVDGIEQMVRTIHGAYIESLIADHPESLDRESLFEYSEQIIQRLSLYPDAARRILYRFSQTDVEDWIQSYTHRVHRPLKAVDEHLARNVVAAFIEYVRTNRRFEDFLLRLIEGEDTQPGPGEATALEEDIT